MPDEKGIIHLGRLTEIIGDIDNLLGEFNESEKDLILREYTNKRNSAKRKQLQRDAVNNIDTRGLLKRLMKGKKDDEDE